MVSENRQFLQKKYPDERVSPHGTVTLGKQAIVCKTFLGGIVYIRRAKAIHGVSTSHKFEIKKECLNGGL